MERLQKDMEKSKGQRVVLSTGLKDKESLKMEEEEELEDVRFSEEETEEDEGEDEEVAHFGFWKSAVSTNFPLWKATSERLILTVQFVSYWILWNW